MTTSSSLMVPTVGVPPATVGDVSKVLYSGAKWPVMVLTRFIWTLFNTQNFTTLGLIVLVLYVVVLLTDC